MSAMHVRRAEAHEQARAAEALSDAFVDEPGMNYWLRQDARKDQARRSFFDAAVANAVHPERELWLAEDGAEALGAAIWLAPGRKAFDFSLWEQIKLAPFLNEIAGIRGSLRGLALAEKLAGAHPEKPHAHLTFLGVAGAAQGKGVGSALLKAALAPLDAAGTIAYLETATTRNVSLYKRQGFEVTSELDVPGLHMWCMARMPH